MSKDSVRDSEIEGMFATRMRAINAAARTGHTLTTWFFLDKVTAGRLWVGATCTSCKRTLELEPEKIGNHMATYRTRTSWHTRRCPALSANEQRGKQEP